jgi:hypothetical protein
MRPAARDSFAALVWRVDAYIVYDGMVESREISAISSFPEDFHRLFGGRPVPKRALPVRHAPVVFYPFPNPLDDFLPVGPHKLSKTCVDRLLALGGFPGLVFRNVDIPRAMFILAADV